MDEVDTIKFSLSRETIKLLGKGLYSNAWSALSELIANGIDAKATNVFVYIDLSNKSKSVIEILDNGTGMSLDSIEKNYVQIGFNKRDNPKFRGDETQMGRKGIGKLAALFLADSYSIKTKTNDPISTATTWFFDINDSSHGSDSFLVRDSKTKFIFDKQFSEQSSGTVLHLFEVDLSNIKEDKICSLSKTMSDYFLYDRLPNKIKVGFFFKTDGNPVDFSSPIYMEKKIAFDNMLALASSEEGFLPFKNGKVQFPTGKIDGVEQKPFLSDRETKTFSAIAKKNQTEGTYSSTSPDGTSVTLHYRLGGWIGIHATIDKTYADKNGEGFEKDAFYSSNRLRLYIRNKLAVSDFIQYLKKTQQGINYIEGEIYFDILDDDRLEDITTSNRQDLDIHDDRVQKLIDMVNEIVRWLIERRIAVASLAETRESNDRNHLYARAKKIAVDSLKKELIELGLTSDQTTQAIASFVNRAKGDNNLLLKTHYKVFFSYQRKDRRFPDFVYHTLIKKGAKKDDIFYALRARRPQEKLESDIKNAIIEDDIYVVFFHSAHYIRNQYSLFEGGAFWATKTMPSCLQFSTTGDCVPDYLHKEPFRVDFCPGNSRLLNDTAFVLDREKYRLVVLALNSIIQELNKSITHSAKKIAPILEDSIPEEDELALNVEKAEKYYDPVVKEMWEFYVVQGLDDGHISKQEYMEKYNKDIEKFEREEKETVSPELGAAASEVLK